MKFSFNLRKIHKLVNSHTGSSERRRKITNFTRMTENVNGQDDVQDKKQKRHDHKHAADLERVTDYIEESELQGKDIANVNK